MDILIVIPRLAPLDGGILVGGSTVSAIRLAGGLRQLGARPTVLCGTPAGNLACPPALPGQGRVQTIPVTQRQASPWYGLSFSYKLIRHILSRYSGYDIISFHSGFPQYAVPLTLAKRFLRVPIIYNLYCPFGTFNGFEKVARPLVRRSLNSIEGIVAISENIAKTVADAGVDGERVHTIPPSVDTRRFNPGVDGQRMRRKLRIADKEVVFLFIGSYAKAKGLELLAHAFSILLQRVPDARLVYTTEHEFPYMERRKERIHAHLREALPPDKANHLRAVPQIESLLAAADVLVVPFLNTQRSSDYPVAILEAMAAGKPVIATAVGGIPEIVRDGRSGMLVEPGSVEALAHAMEILARDKEKRSRLGANAIRLAQDFAITKVARKTLDFYEKTRNKRHNHARFNRT